MRKLPILFSPDMVRALLARRKTQTRRVFNGIEQLPNGSWHVKGAGGGILGVADADVPTVAVDYVRHAAGDELWVREDWRTYKTSDHIRAGELEPQTIWWMADDYRRPVGESPFGRRRASMHMPRWASRLTLAVADVRVQRLQAINEADAIAEGIAENVDEPKFRWAARPDCTVWYPDPIAAYAFLWTEINGPGSWDANPWVITTTFTVATRNIDAQEHANA